MPNRQEDPLPRLEAGTTLVSRYEVTDLEASPFLDVEQWRAEDKIFGRTVDVFVIDDSVPAGALNRARKSAQLNVERIARVIDIVDKGPDSRYVVTEHPEGVVTAAAIAFAPFTMKQTKAVIGAIASSLVKAAETQGLRHGAITSDSIVFKNDTVTLTGLVPRNFLGLNDSIDDDSLALRDTRGLAALTYFMLTGLMANYASDETTPVPKLFGFVEDADPNIDVYTTDILNASSDAIATPQEFLEAFGDWSLDNLPYVHKPEKPLAESSAEGSDELPPSVPPQRMSARSAASSAVPLPSTQPVAAAGAVGAKGGATMGGAAAALGDAAAYTSATSADATSARAVGGPPRFLPGTNDMQLGKPAPQVFTAVTDTTSPDSAVWAAPPLEDSGKKGLSATPFVLSLFGIGIIVALVWSFSNIMAPTEPAFVSPSVRPSSSAGEGTGGKPSETSKPEIVLPVAKTAQSLDPDGDNNEHPELQDLLVDGDASTAWYSRTYKTSNFGGIAKSGIGVQVGLEKKATVSTVLISSLNTGGKIEIRATNAKNPSKGKVLASGPLDGETVFKLSEPTETDSIVVWITDLPSDQQGKFRVYLYEISLT